jgi:hypothetical protein
MITPAENHIKLKTNFWRKLANENSKPIFHYDEVLDTFFFYISAEEKDRIITRFIDENVAFLYRYSDKEFVGLRVEYFKKRFLQKYANKNWILSKTGFELDGMKDFAFRIEAVKTSPLGNQYTIPRPIESQVHLEPTFA